MLRRIFKWTGRGLILIVALLLLTYGYIYFSTQGRINTKYEFADEILTLPIDSFSLQKGKHLYQIRGCQDCHGASLEGSVFMNDAMLMRITAPNLTSGKGGLGADYSVVDWVRTIRHGVDENGRSLMMMPSHELYQLTNDDLANIIAYCMAQEPVNTSQEKLHSIGPVGRVLLAMNQVTVLPAEKIDHRAVPLDRKTESTGIEYGKYLSIGCQGCHRPNMRGGSPLAPGFPPVPDITSNGHLGKWSESSFIATIRSGRTPEGKALDNQFMPWESIGHFTDDELKSIYQYLNSLKGG